MLKGWKPTSLSPVTISEVTRAKYGGELHVGGIGGSSTDTLTPYQLINTLDVLRNYQLFEALIGWDKAAQTELLLAEEFTPNANATEWTVRVRKGVTFHNGKELTADDVIYSYQRITNPKSPGIGASAIAVVDVAGMKKLDTYTVRIPCRSPFSSLLDLQPTFNYSIVPVGFDPRHPVGTGPFKFESFTPGVQSVFSRNPNYWQSGLPYTDRVVITDFSDESSQIDGLVSGAVNLINSLSAVSIAAVRSGGAKVVIADGASWTPITMRVDQTPFKDIRVREAFRLLVDREEMLNAVFGGYGTIGNDLFAIQDPLYDHSIPQRPHDVAQARYLLKKAGYDNDLTVTFTTANIMAGATEAATVFAQQAKAAGVTVNVDVVPVTTFDGPEYLKWTFAQDNYYSLPYMAVVQYTEIKGGVFNECHIATPAFAKLFNQLLGTTDLPKQKSIAADMQELEYNGTASGYIIPYFLPQIDGYAANIRGTSQSRTGIAFGGGDLKQLWIT